MLITLFTLHVYIVYIVLHVLNLEEKRMAECRWCGKSGLLVAVSKRGLCKNCEKVIGKEISEKTQEIKEAVEIIEKAGNENPEE